MLVAAGCGDDNNTSGSGTSGGSSSGGSSGAAASDPAVKAAVENCKSSLSAVPNIKPDTKTKLEKICEDAANGDAEAVKKATKDVCEAIVVDTVPDGPAQDQAKEACAAAGG